MAKTITYAKELLVDDGKNPFSPVPEGTKSRVYYGDHLAVMQNFMTNGSMTFVMFNKTTRKKLDVLTREQMNDLVNMMQIISENKEKLYPKEFLEGA